MPTYHFNAIETADIADLQINERHLRCYVWTGTPENSFGAAAGFEQTIEAAICEVLEGGEMVEIYRGTVRRPGSVGEICDSPKVVGVVDFDGVTVRSLFVLHWLEGARAGTPDLFHSYLNPEDDTYAWSAAASIPTSSAWLYDVCPIEGGLAGYAVVHRESGTLFTAMRFLTVTGGWAGFVYAQGHTIDAEPGGLLAVYAHAVDGYVCYAWERELAGAAPGQIWCRRIDLLTGAGGTSWRAMTGLAENAWVCGGWKRRSGNRWMLVVEGKPMYDNEGIFTTYEDSDLSFVAWELQNVLTPAISGGAGRCWNLRLLSRPFGRANGLTSGATRIIYAICGFSEIAQSDYGQSSAFVVELEPCDSDLSQRALPAGNINLRLVDARAAGAHPNSTMPGDTAARGSLGRRANHVSSLGDPVATGSTTGYTCEARSFHAALVVYTKLVTIPNPFPSASEDTPTLLVPQQTSVVGYSVVLEEPWVRQRDTDDAGTTEANFKGVFAWHPYHPVPVADMLAIAGGLPQIYDGRRPVEIGWAWYPEIVEIQETSGSGADDTYVFAAYYEWTDAAGHIHRSAPSTPISITLAGGGSNGVTLRIQCATLSRRFDLTAPEERHAQIVVLRADGTVFRRIHGATSGADAYQATPWNEPDNAAITVDDDLSDISTHEPAPWQFVDGAWVPLVPQMPPAASVGCVWRNRLLLSPSEEPNTIWYSLEVQPGPGSQAIAAPEFSSTNVYRFDAEALRITAMVPMDDHVIVFGEHAIYALTGDFNNDAGFGASLVLTAIHRGIGCIDQRSVVRTSDGVFFQSDGGIEFMDRGWGLSNLTIGSSVEDDVRVAGNLRSATWIEKHRQVRWTGNASADGEPIVLVYHYVAKIWTRFTLPEGDQTSIVDGDSWMSTAADGCVWRAAAGEQLHVVLQQGALLIERDANDEDLHYDQVRSGTSGNSSDTSAYNGFDLQTSWLSLAGLAGLARVRKADIHADPAEATDPDLGVTVEFELASGEYPDLAPQSLSRSAPHDGYIRAPLRVQKLSALRIRLQRSGSFTTLPTWSVLGLSLEVGIRRGPRRVPDTQKAT
jgi:hypothetical protein